MGNFVSAGKEFGSMNRHTLEENIFKGLMIFSMMIVLGSLSLILLTIFMKGLPAISLKMLLQTPQGGYYIGKEGGILNAIVGSLVLAGAATLLAFVISLPIALYLNLYLKKNSKFAYSIRFLFDVLYGIPAIVYGAFGFSVMVFFHLRASLLAGILTIALLIIPIMARSMDEVLKMIPFELKEASVAIGATRWETATKVILKQALPGITTAILIAFGRGIGDAAAVLFTTGFTDSLPTSLFQPVATLPLAIFFQLATPFPDVQARGYASAFVLTVLILFISLISRILSSRFTRNIVK